MASALLLAGCGKPATRDAEPRNASVRAAGDNAMTIPVASALPAATGVFIEADYLGRWRGVEGMYLTVGKARQAGSYTLKMQWDLDHHGAFTATATRDPVAPGLSFARDSKQLLLRRTDGPATGLKYLAGKKDCLTITSGEGYCRD